MGLFNTEENIRKIKWKDILSPLSYSVWRNSSLTLFFKGDDLEHLTSYKSDQLLDLSIKFSKNIFADDSYFDPEKDISTQLFDILKDLTDFPIEVKNFLVRFDNKIHPTFVLAYEQYMIRHNFGQVGFEHPDKVGYLYIIINKEIHWFYPIQAK